jgi:glyceraldehyde-3-phosphate dehydrogenase (NADP+)
MGLPWEKDVSITPLGEEGKPKYLLKVIEDAKSKGAKVVNERGGKFDRSFVSPTVNKNNNEKGIVPSYK